MPLVRLTQGDGSWSRLEDAWTTECQDLGEDYADFAGHTIKHAREIASETMPDRNYGIFGLEERAGAIDGIMHINRAMLPKTAGYTLRVLWILLAPRYDFGDVSAADFAHVATDIVMGAIDLACSAGMPCKHIKIHLGGAVDRAIFTGVASGVTGSAYAEMSVRGSWLHIDGVVCPVRHQKPAGLKVVR